jgi:hypothetical protein
MAPFYWIEGVDALTLFTPGDNFPPLKLNFSGEYLIGHSCSNIDIKSP